MEKNLIRYGCTILVGLLLTGFATARAATQNYLMWQMPGSSISLPVYVYSGGSQVSYIPSDSLQVFVGPYTKGKTNGSYQLYYQSSSTWYSCNLALKAGSIDSKNTTCPGAVINPPASQNGANSNVYTVGLAATSWTAQTNGPNNPVATDYSKRTLTFTNNTQYAKIQIGESCNPANATNSAPSCQNSPIIATIAQGASHTVTVGLQGLNSAAFYMSSYCTSAAAACGTPPTVAQCSSTPTPTPPANWVCTGGYFPGQVPYATKIEPTILAVTNGVPNGASNVDVSAVDGYSIGVKFYPASPAYCTYTVPPENSNVLGAGYYSQQSPLAQLVPTSGTALAKMCAASSQLPAKLAPSRKKRTPPTPWNLVKASTSGQFAGCMSPCTYATANLGNNDITQDTVNQFCCTGSYNTPGTCDVPPGSIGANTSTYNMNIQKSSQFKNVYGFAYGDAGSDYACPAETNFVVEFVSGPASK
jgi:hypothetical protein